MKHPFHCNILPFFTLGAGGLGLALRFWLFSATDEKGLLPVGHVADYALYILTALTLGIVFLATRQLTPRRISKRFFRLSGVYGYAMGAAGLLFAALQTVSGNVVRLGWLSVIAMVLGCLVMLFMALLKFFRKRPPYLFSALLTVVLMLNTVSQCQIWGKVPQLQAYFFPLLASVFLIMSAYHATKHAAGRGNPRLLAFFSQSALFLCCLSLNCTQGPLYFGMLFWAGAQLYPCILARKEA